jgi:UPF0176 protein
MQSGPILNISCYLFVSLTDTATLRDCLHARAEALGLKGTVLIAEEGINLFLAGEAAAVDAWVGELRADPRFADLTPKQSWSEVQPFQRLKVKVKPEIIRMNHPTIRPDRRPARRPGARGAGPLAGPGPRRRRPEVVLLDTRNGFEVDYGLRDAIDWRLEKFSDFPEALARTATNWSARPW